MAIESLAQGTEKRLKRATSRTCSTWPISSPGDSLQPEKKTGLPDDGKADRS